MSTLGRRVPLVSRYHLIDTTTGEVVRTLQRRPRLTAPKVYRVRRTAQLERELKFAAMLAVVLTALLVAIR